jgi:hypothetical protein
LEEKENEDDPVVAVNLVNLVKEVVVVDALKPVVKEKKNEEEPEKEAEKEGK